MLYRVTHETEYAYADAVAVSHNALRLRPRDLPLQECRRSDITIDPWPAIAASRRDYFGNHATFAIVQQPHERITFRAVSEVRVTPPHQLALGQSAAWEAVRDTLRDAAEREALEAYQFVFDSPLVRASRDLAEYAAPSFTPGRPLVDAALDLMRRVFKDFRYDQTATTVATPLEDVYANRCGVCQDFAHLTIGCLRSLGLPARYVSGYLRTFRDARTDPKLIGADASHAWVSVYCTGLGWIDLDPTNNQRPSEHHVTLAWGRDYSDVSPVKGIILGGGEHTIRVRVEVKPIE